MSAWSSATGKAQLSYADRLRQATKPSANPVNARNNEASSSTPESSMKASRSPPGDPHSSNSSSSSTKASNSKQAPPHVEARTSSGPQPSDVAAKSSSTSAEASSSSASTSTFKTVTPPVNVWEARKKQLAERESEREKERIQSQPTSNRIEPRPGSTAAPPANASRTKAGNASGSKTRTERSSKGSSSTLPQEKRGAKSSQSNEAIASGAADASKNPSRRGAPVDPSPSRSSVDNAANAAAAKSDLTKSQSATAENGSAPETPAALLDDRDAKKDSEEVKDAHHISNELPKTDPPVDLTASSLDSKGKEPGNVPTPVPPTSPPTRTAYTSPEDIPSSPATVASAIEEVLRNGSASGSRAGDDDAWLARIHLLNGGQNMPNFGGLGSNGTLSIGGGLQLGGSSSEEELQAAKKAERAVAAAWGAGKNVWQKSQQPKQPEQQPQASIASIDEHSQRGRAASVSRVSTDNVNSSAVLKRTSTSEQPQGSSTDAGTSKGTKGSLPASNAKSAGDGVQRSSAKAAEKNTMKKASSKDGSSKKGPQLPPPPSFEDAASWPSPFDAGKKSAVKPRNSTGASDAMSGEGSAKLPQSDTAKSIYDTLDELQVKLAPGSTTHQAAGTSNGKKGKQQWIPIVPDITHSSSSASSNQRPLRSTEAKAGKQANKQARKDQQKGSNQGSQQGGRKDTGNAKTGAKSEEVSASREKPTEAAAAATSQAQNEGSPTTPASTEAADHADGKAEQPTEAGPPLTTHNPASGASTADTQETEHQTRDSSPSKSSVSQAASSDLTTQVPMVSTLEAALANVSLNQGERRDSISKRGGRGGKSNVLAFGSHRLSNAGLDPSSPLTPSEKRRDKMNGIPAHAAANSSPSQHRSSPRESRSFGAYPTFSRGEMPYADSTSASDVSSGMPSMYVPPPAPVFYPGAGAPVVPPPQASAVPGSVPWMPYMPFAQPPVFVETTAQMGAPIPPGTIGQLLGQIEFYFSQRNLEGDFFLRQRMDSQGWVDISVVANFKRVQGITRDLGMVKDALLYSAVLDVDVESMKVRRRYGWELYVLPEAGAPAAAAAAADIGQKNSSEPNTSLEETGTSATPSKESTEFTSPPSSFSRASHDGAHEAPMDLVCGDTNANAHSSARSTQKSSSGSVADEDDHVLGVVAASGLGGTLDTDTDRRS